MESFIEVPAGSDFPLHNLPFGAYTRPGNSKPNLCVALGDNVVDLGQLQQAGCFSGPILSQQGVFTQVSPAQQLCGSTSPFRRMHWASTSTAFVWAVCRTP